jgi:cytochrome P450
VDRLLNGTFDGAPIPQDKQLGMLGILLLGGLETARASIGNIAYRVATSPGTEDRLRDPDTLVFNEPRSGHAAFGLGVHRCVGSNLARLQIEIAFGELLKRSETCGSRQARRSPGCRATATSCTP